MLTAEVLAPVERLTCWYLNKGVEVGLANVDEVVEAAADTLKALGSLCDNCIWASASSGDWNVAPGAICCCCCCWRLDSVAVAGAWDV